jgi:CBS domain containing-hemolysin-like protein
MSDADALGLLLVLLCLTASMFFSGSETAITSFDAHRAQRIVEEDGRSGKVMAFWVRDPVRVLSTILVGNNIANTLLGAVITAMAIRHLEGGPWGDYAVGAAVFVATALLLVVGEITPKALGKLFTDRITIPALWVLKLLSRIIAPILWIVMPLTNRLIRRAAPDADASASLARVTSDDISYMIKVGHRDGSIAADQAALLSSMVRFEAKIARDIMIPENRVTAVNLAWDVRQVREVALRSGHSRFPVYEGSLIKGVKGVLHIKQMVGLADSDSIVRLVRPPVFIGQSMRLHDLLQRFKDQRVHLAIVVDDAGDTVGVVTLEDVLEQIVGQIFDETDRAPFPGVVEQGGTHIVDGQDSMRRIEELLDVELPELEGVGSVGDLLTHLAGQIPNAGSVFLWEGLRFRVMEADARHLVRVRVDRPVEGDSTLADS